MIIGIIGSGGREHAICAKILESKNIIETCYWYEWILNYENILKKKKIKCQSEGRSYAPKNFYNDIIRILWDIIFFYSKLLDDKLITKIINGLFTLFCIKFNLMEIKVRELTIWSVLLYNSPKTI